METYPDFVNLIQEIFDDETYEPPEAANERHAAYEKLQRHCPIKVSLLKRVQCNGLSENLVTAARKTVKWDWLVIRRPGM